MTSCSCTYFDDYAWYIEPWLAFQAYDRTVTLTLPRHNLGQAAGPGHRCHHGYTPDIWGEISDIFNIAIIILYIL